MFSVSVTKNLKFYLTRRFFFRLIYFVGTFIVLSILFLFFSPWKISSGLQDIEVIIPNGLSPKHIASRLKKNSIIQNELKFLWCVQLMGVTRKLKAGSYRFQGFTTNYHVIKKISTGEVVTESITIPEGLRATKIAGLFQKHFGIDSTQFMKLCMDSAFCHSLQIPVSSLEGYLYPDTYQFNINPTIHEILEKIISHFKTIFADSLMQKAGQVGLSVHHVLTLASIVEGEAVIDSERSFIAALYLNRLRHGIPLQADPTIQYLIPDGPRRLLKKDLKINSPYNTYLNPGLPPGPVNNPGLASILAVLHPAPINYLYMVANGDGSHTFSRTLEEHLSAKYRFDQIRKQVKRH